MRSLRRLRPYLLQHRTRFLQACLVMAGVACLAGTSFGSYGEGYLRFSYANSVENIQAAIEKIREALPRLDKVTAAR